MSKKWFVCRTSLFVALLCAAAGSASVSFRTAVAYPVGNNPAFVAQGDFNADGKPDLVVVNAGDRNLSNPGGISILLGNGDGTFQPAMDFSAGNNPASVAVGDFDGDGKDDLAVQRPGDGQSDAGDITIFISNGDGSFRKGQVITSVLVPSALLAADFNSDGILDLAAVQGSNNQVKVSLGKGAGTFSDPKTFESPSTIYGRKLEVLDFNRDGKEDIAVTGAGGGSVLTGNGDGTFQAGIMLGNSTFLDSLEFVGDFNQDGNIDAILTHCTLGGFPPKPHCTELVQLNDGNRSLSDAPVISPLPDRTHTVADFNGDGNLDIAGIFSSNNSPGAGVFLGNGDGSFQQPLSFPADSPASMQVALSADLNNDKAPDLVLIDAIAGANMISVILNSGTDFTLDASPLTPSNIGAGQSASSTVGLQLLNLFDNPVALSCSVKPAQTGAPTCSLDVKSVTFDSTGKASATLTISAGSFALLRTGDLINSAAPIWFPILGIALLARGFCLRVRDDGMGFRILPFAALLALVFLAACSGTYSGGPKSTNYAITITGASGQTSHSSTLTVTIQ